MEEQFWRKCSTCKKPLGFNSKYYVCNVSTCNGQRTGYVFCSVGCFESHLPGARHKDAYAVEETSPRSGGAAAEPARAPARIIVGAAKTSSTPASPAISQGEVLVIASRFKDYISARSGFNTSQSVMDLLSDHLRVLAERGIDSARADGRKTVMDRDFQFLKSGK